MTDDLNASYAESLSVLASMIAFPLSDALQAFFVTMSADGFFLDPERRKLFHTNPANTMPYRALKAMEERAAIEVAERARDKESHFPLRPGFVIRGIPELRNHRDVLSHPATLKWRPDLQPFADEHREFLDFKAGILWDLQKSINEELVVNGLAAHNTDVVVTVHMVEMLHLILRLSVVAGASVPDAAWLRDWMEHWKPKFLAELERVPRGRLVEEPASR